MQMEKKSLSFQFWKMLGIGFGQGGVLFIVLFLLVQKLESIPELPIVSIGKLLITLLLSFVWILGIFFGMSVLSLQTKIESTYDRKEKDTQIRRANDRLIVAWGCFETGLVLLPFLLLFETRIVVFLSGAAIFLGSFFFMAPWRFKSLQ